MTKETTENAVKACTAPGTTEQPPSSDEEAPEPPAWDMDYTGWGRCGKCNAKVPAAGARIGFFGKQDLHPQWCRECVVKHGDAELLEIWDEYVTAEAERRASRKARQKEDKALMGTQIITKKGP